MTALLPDLWGDGIAVKIRSPLVILKQQAALLEQKTAGILRAEVQSVHADERVKHSLIVMAPRRYSVSIVGAEHRVDMPYPVRLSSIDKSTPLIGLSSVESSNPLLKALDDLSIEGKITSEPEFIEKLGEVLKSARVSAIISSLIARSNEIADSASNGADNG